MRHGHWYPWYCDTCCIFTRGSASDIMDWAVDTTGLIITSVTCCGQEAQSVSDTSGGRSGTRSCCWMVDQICADPVWPPTPECVVLQTLLQLTCMWNANQFCPSRVLPVQRVWCRTESLWSSDNDIASGWFQIVHQYVWYTIYTYCY